MFRKKIIQEIGITSELVKKNDFLIQYTTQIIPDTILLKYLGAGGYYFRYKDAALLIDPFFSPYGIYRLGLFNIHTKTENVRNGLEDIADEVHDKVNAVLITHAHYDHLLDAPYVFNHYLRTNDPDINIYGNSSVKTRVGQVLDTARVVDISSNISRSDKPGKWIYLNNSSIRIMPVHTHHAPHLKNLFSISLYSGEAKPIPRYKSDTASTHVTRWKGGCTFAYLIDMLEDDKIIFRIYILTSASQPPDGYVAKSDLDKHPVNLAILGAASAGNVDNYPAGIINHLNPEKLILAHWEDLFKPYLVENPRLIRATNFKKLLPAINDVYPWKVEDVQYVFMPEPGVKVIILM